MAMQEGRSRAAPKTLAAHPDESKAFLPEVERTWTKFVFGLFPARLLQRDHRRSFRQPYYPTRPDDLAISSRVLPEPGSEQQTIIMLEFCARKESDALPSQDLLQQAFLRETMARSFQCFYGSDDAVSSDEESRVERLEISRRSARHHSSALGQQEPKISQNSSASSLKSDNGHFARSGSALLPTHCRLDVFQQVQSAKQLSMQRKDRTPVSMGRSGLRTASAFKFGRLPWLSPLTLNPPLLLSTTRPQSGTRTTNRLTSISTDDVFACSVPRRLRFLHRYIYWGDTETLLPGSEESQKALTSRLASTIRPRQLHESTLCCLSCSAAGSPSSVLNCHPFMLAPAVEVASSASRTQPTCAGLYRRVPLLVQSMSALYEPIAFLSFGKRLAHLHYEADEAKIAVGSDDDHPDVHATLEQKQALLQCLQQIWTPSQIPLSHLSQCVDLEALLASNVSIFAASCKFTQRKVVLKRTPLEPSRWRALVTGQAMPSEAIPGWNSCILALQLNNIPHSKAPRGWHETGVATQIEVLLSEADQALYQVLEFVPKSTESCTATELGLLASPTSAGLLPAPTLFESAFCKGKDSLAGGPSFTTRDVSELIKQVLTILVGLRDPLALLPVRKSLPRCPCFPVARFPSQIFPGTNVAHRDLKPHNLVCVSIDQKETSSIDRGQCGSIRHWASKRMVLLDLDDLAVYDRGLSEKNTFDPPAAGSPLFVAPEVFHRRTRSFRTSDDTVDMWSVGVLLCSLAPKTENLTDVRKSLCLGPATGRTPMRSRVVSDDCADFSQRRRVRSTSCPPPPPRSMYALGRNGLDVRTQPTTSRSSEANSLTPEDVQLLRSRLSLESVAHRFANLTAQTQPSLPLLSRVECTERSQAHCRCVEEMQVVRPNQNIFQPRSMFEILTCDTESPHELLDLARMLLQPNPLLRPKPDEGLRHALLHLSSPDPLRLRHTCGLFPPDVFRGISIRMHLLRRLLLVPNSRFNDKLLHSFTLQYTFKARRRARRILLSLLAVSTFLTAAASSQANILHRHLPRIAIMPGSQTALDLITFGSQLLDGPSKWQTVAPKMLAKPGRKGLRNLKKLLTASKAATTSCLATITQSPPIDLRAIQSVQRSLRHAIFRLYSRVEDTSSLCMSTDDQDARSLTTATKTHIKSDSQSVPFESTTCLTLLAPGLTVDLRDWTAQSGRRGEMILERQLRELKRLGVNFLVRLVLIPPPKVISQAVSPKSFCISPPPHTKLYAASPSGCVPFETVGVSPEGTAVSQENASGQAWLELGAPLPRFDSLNMCGLLDLPLLLPLAQVSVSLASQYVTDVQRYGENPSLARAYQDAIVSYAELRKPVVSYTLQNLLPAILQAEEAFRHESDAVAQNAKIQETPNPICTSTTTVIGALAPTTTATMHSDLHCTSVLTPSLNRQPQAKLLGLGTTNDVGLSMHCHLTDGAIMSKPGKVNGVVLQISPLVPSIRAIINCQKLRKSQRKAAKDARRLSSSTISSQPSTSQHDESAENKYRPPAVESKSDATLTPTTLNYSDTTNLDFDYFPQLGAIPVGKLYRQSQKSKNSDKDDKHSTQSLEASPYHQSIQPVAKSKLYRSLTPTAIDPDSDIDAAPGDLDDDEENYYDD